MRPRWIFAAVLLALFGVVLPPSLAGARSASKWEPATQTSWLVSPGGDNFLTGYNQTEKAPAFINCRTAACAKTGDGDGPWLEWVTKLSDLPTGAYVTSGVVADGGLLYVGGGATNSFMALNAATGLPVWRFSPDPRTDGDTAQYPASNAPTIHNGLVYTTFANGYMYALNAKTGRKIWSFRATDGYTDKTASRPGDADHPRRSALDSYTDSSQPRNRSAFGAVHPGVAYPKPHGRSAVCAEQNVAAFMTLAGWAYGIDATTGKPLWKRYVDAPEFPGEMVWPEYKEGGALKAQNSSVGSTTRRFEAVPGLACANGELQILGSDGHLRYLEPRTG